jgi:Heavy metal binding domain
MDRTANTGQVYLCPMHADVRQPGPGKCSKCGMDLLAEGTRFALLRHMMSSPLHLGAMVVVMVAVMAAAMVMMVH